MALKDWKKVSKDERGTQVFHKGNKRVSVYRITNLSIYGVLTYSVGETGSNKSFKTKAQALKFARSYMRTH